ncbi:glycoside hydrolase [Mycena vitilis]|nr:glycoside hydrolase [Mycena vitilis]
MRHTPSLRVLLASLSLITSAAAHGYITNVTINSTVYRGNVLAQSDQTPFLSIIWQKFSNDPVVSTGTPDLTSTDLICGHKATRAAKSAPVAAGDAISIAYYSDYNPDSSKWPHAVGPVMIYLADCGAMTCDKFDVTKAQWFKIDEQGKNKTGDWPAQYALSVGSSLALTIPSNLNPGNYILRHEIVSLERSSANITEFYPNCFDLIVSGTGNGRPTTKETVRFPGAYKATDTDIGYYDVRARQRLLSHFIDIFVVSR